MRTPTGCSCCVSTWAVARSASWWPASARTTSPRRWSGARWWWSRTSSPRSYAASRARAWCWPPPKASAWSSSGPTTRSPRERSSVSERSADPRRGPRAGLRRHAGAGGRRSRRAGGRGGGAPRPERRGQDDAAPHPGAAAPAGRRRPRPRGGRGVAAPPGRAARRGPCHRAHHTRPRARRTGRDPARHPPPRARRMDAGGRARARGGRRGLAGRRRGSRLTMRGALAILAKDLRIEWRTRESLASVFVLGVLLLVVLTVAHDPTPEAAPALAPAVLWVSFVFTGLAGIQRGFLLERENDCLAGLLTAPVDPADIYAGKLAANVVLLAVTQAVVVPLAGLFLHAG